MICMSRRSLQEGSKEEERRSPKTELQSQEGEKGKEVWEKGQKAARWC